jgi:hypothetical protein
VSLSSSPSTTKKKKWWRNNWLFTCKRVKLNL